MWFLSDLQESKDNLQYQEVQPFLGKINQLKLMNCLIFNVINKTKLFSHYIVTLVVVLSYIDQTVIYIRCLIAD